MIPSSNIAFSSSVKGVQMARGSRELYARVEAGGDFRTKIDARLKVAAALAARDDEITRLKAELAALQTAEGDE